MKTSAADQVLTEATIENPEDLWAVRVGVMSSDQVRRVTIGDAVVDTGTTLLALPTRLVRQLGLRRTGTRRTEADVYQAVRLTIQGRTCTMEVPDNVPVLIGHLALTHLDFVIDPQSRSLIGNPADGAKPASRTRPSSKGRVRTIKGLLLRGPPTGRDTPSPSSTKQSTRAGTNGEVMNVDSIHRTTSVNRRNRPDCTSGFRSCYLRDCESSRLDTAIGAR